MEEDRERGQIKNKMYNLCKHSRSQENGFSESGMASACDLLLLPPIAPPEPPAKENLKLINSQEKKNNMKKNKGWKVYHEIIFHTPVV